MKAWDEITSCLIWLDILTSFHEGSERKKFWKQKYFSFWEIRSTGKWLFYIRLVETYSNLSIKRLENPVISVGGNVRIFLQVAGEKMTVLNTMKWAGGPGPLALPAPPARDVRDVRDVRDGRDGGADSRRGDGRSCPADWRPPGHGGGQQRRHTWWGRQCPPRLRSPDRTSEAQRCEGPGLSGNRRSRIGSDNYWNLPSLWSPPRVSTWRCRPQSREGRWWRSSCCRGTCSGCWPRSPRGRLRLPASS